MAEEEQMRLTEEQLRCIREESRGRVSNPA